MQEYPRRGSGDEGGVMGNKGKEYIDLSKVRLYLHFLNGNQMNVNIREVIFFGGRAIQAIAFGMSGNMFRVFVPHSGWGTNQDQQTKKQLAHKISTFMSGGGSLTLVNQNKEDPDDIILVPVSALELLTLRFEKEDSEDSNET
ncbi:MAG: hypothetical protein HYS15_03570 [Candidatus Spechtbacteria bacterium]|nr:hypothetical protein [Candidatus Spechtbacteria bacterium]